MGRIKELEEKTLECTRLNQEEALSLFDEDLLTLGRLANEVRKRLHPEGVVTFVIDRNINYTNICISRCKFCAFWRDEGSEEAYILPREAIYKKIEETLGLGGTSILIQGGLHPALKIEFFEDLFSSIKSRYPIHIHGLSPPEIYHIAKISGLTLEEAIQRLKEAGLGSIPGGGAEILSPKIRSALSPRKVNVDGWLEVMEVAHRLGLKTTATMMFGCIESAKEIIEHLDKVRSLQDRTKGFTAFIPWTFQPAHTELEHIEKATAIDYLKVLAISRIYLDNFPNIQASWVTQGAKIAQVALRFGANDFGSTMLEENVVAAAGASFRIGIDEIIRCIKNAGFIPAQRDTTYHVLKTF